MMGNLRLHLNLAARSESKKRKGSFARANLRDSATEHLVS
jgi:hypothetical protein